MLELIEAERQGDENAANQLLQLLEKDYALEE